MQSAMAIFLSTCIVLVLVFELSSGVPDISGICDKNYEGPSVTCDQRFRSPTCQGFCGYMTTLFQHTESQRLNLISCSCDEACLVYGDCCQDIQEACPSEYDAAVDLKQKTGDVEPTCTGKNSMSTKLLIASCPTSWTDQSVRQKCQSFLDVPITAWKITSVQDFMLLSPVEDLTTGLNYRNKYCAQCNNITEAQSWRSTFTCYGFNASLVSLPYLLKNTEKYDCRIFDWLHPKSRDCLAASVDSCPGSCNNSALVEKCHSYQSIVSTGPQTFRNIDCASCNLEDLMLHEKDNSTIEAFCELPRVTGPGYHSVSFSVIFSLKEEQEEVDISYSNQAELLVSNLKYKSRQLCQNDQQCSTTQCSLGFAMTPDGCEARTGNVEFVLQLSLLPKDKMSFTGFELETIDTGNIGGRVKAASNSSLDVLTDITSSEIAMNSSQNVAMRQCVNVTNNAHELKNITKIFLYIVLYDVFDPLNNSVESRNERVEANVVSILNATHKIESANWYSASWPYSFCHGSRFGTPAQKCDTATFSTSSFKVIGNRTIELISDSYEAKTFGYSDVIFAEDIISVCRNNLTHQKTEKLPGAELALTVLTFVILGLSAIALIIRLSIQLAVPSYQTRAGVLQSLYGGALLVFTLVYLTTLAVYTVRGPGDFAVSVLTIFSFFFFTFVYCSLNALCVNVYRVLSDPLKAKDRSSASTISAFLLHSFLPSVIILITCLCLEFVSGVPFSWQPLFGFCGPWICQRNPHLIFFVVPFGISIVSNISLFIATSILIKRSSDIQKQMTSTSSSSRRNQIIFRLSIMMGMFWISGIIDIFFDDVVVEFITTILIAGQGLFFVINSVHKKTWQNIRKRLSSLHGNSKTLYTMKESSSR